MRRIATLQFLEPYREYGPLLVRLLLGVILIEGTQDNVLSRERMDEFAGFLASNGFPWPRAGAVVSAWAQFLTGFLVILGLFTRPAAAIVVVNFVVAILLVHRGLTFEQNRLVLWMLTGGLFLLIHGPGRLALDGWLESRGRLAGRESRDGGMAVVD